MVITWWGPILSMMTGRKSSSVNIAPCICHTSCCRAYWAIDHVLLPLSPSATSVLMHFKEWRLLYTSRKKSGGSLNLALHASRGEILWCRHLCAIPISWSRKWGLWSSGRLVFLSTSNALGVRLTKYNGTAPKILHYTTPQCLFNNV